MLFITFLAMLLLGCSDFEPNFNENTKQESFIFNKVNPKMQNIVLVYEEPFYTPLKNYFDYFNKNNPWNITVIPIPLTEALTKKDFKINLFLGNNDSVYNKNGQNIFNQEVRNLSLLFKDDRYPTKFINPHYLNFYTNEDGLKSIPLEQDAYVLYYNLDLLEKLGFSKAPTNFMEWNTLIENYKKNFNSEYKFFMLEKGIDYFTDYFLSLENNEELMQNLLNLMESQSIVSILNRQTKEDAFAQGKLLFVIDKLSKNMDYKESIEIYSFLVKKWNIIPFYKEKDREIYPIPQGLSLLMKTPEEDLASFLFLRYLLNKEILLSLHKAIGGISFFNYDNEPLNVFYERYLYYRTVQKDAVFNDYKQKILKNLNQ